jgi:hypothetical protein
MPFRIDLDQHAGKFRYLFLILLYLIACLIVINIFMSLYGFRGDSERYGFTKMMSYSAEKPFCYRALTPIIINGLTNIIPDSFLSTLEKDLLKDSELLKYKKDQNIRDIEISVKYHLTYFYMFLCLAAIIFLARSLTRLVYNPPQVVVDTAPFAALILFPMTFIHGGYMYDFPELMFFLLGLLFALRSSWLGYYLILPLAVINKETGILLIVYFIALKFKDMPRNKFWIHLIIQLIIGSILLILIRYLFSGNPDPTVEFRLWTNLKFWLNPLSYLKFTEIYAPLIGVPRGGNIIILALLAFAVLYRWKDKPILIRKLLIYSAIVIIPIFLYYGNRDELRTLTVLFPPLYLLGVHTAWKLYDNLNRKTAG